MAWHDMYDMYYIRVRFRASFVIDIYWYVIDTFGILYIIYTSTPSKHVCFITGILIYYAINDCDVNHRTAKLNGSASKHPT